jgi:DNA polymerase-3 subunit epsilon
MTAPWFARLAAFDLETTGIEVAHARIVSACVAELDADGAVVGRRDWLVDPGIEIPASAAAVHGISTERVRAEGAPAATAVPEIVEAVRAVFDRGVGLTVYNASYDLSLLAHEARRYGVPPIAMPSPVVDPLIIDKQVDKYRKGKRTLELACAHYGVALDDAHDAGADAIAAARVAQAIARAFPREPALTAIELHDLQVQWAAAQQADFAAYMRRSVDPDWVSDRPAWPGGES